MWVARVLEHSDEYMRRCICPMRKAANSKTLQPVPPHEKSAQSLLLVAYSLSRRSVVLTAPSSGSYPKQAWRDGGWGTKDPRTYHGRGLHGGVKKR